MMRNILFYIAFVAFSLGSCSRFEKEVDEKMDFSNVDISNTRGSVIADVDFDKFSVFSYFTEINDWASVGSMTSPNIMFNQLVEKSGSAWMYTPIKYWSSNAAHLYSFFAFSPTILESNSTLSLANSFTSSSTGAPQVDYTTSNTIGEQIDFVVADRKDQTKESGTVNLQFSHALSMINFAVKTADGVEATTEVKITQLDIIIPSGKVDNKALYNFADSSWTNTPAATSSLDIPTPQSILSASNNSVMGGEQAEVITSETGNLFLLPQTIEKGDITVKVAYQATINKGEIGESLLTPETIDLQIPAMTFVRNKKYTFNIIIDVVTAKIYFGIPTISDWGTDASQINRDIDSAEKLAKIGVDSDYPLDGIYTITADFPITGNWTPIGTLDSPFTGRIKGDGHTISGLTINNTSRTDGSGLFGAISGGSVSDLTISNPNISVKGDAGALAAYINDCQIDNCNILGGSVTSAEGKVGGIAAEIFNSIVLKCHNNGCAIAGLNAMGGLAAESALSDFVACYNLASITASTTDIVTGVGGIIGLDRAGTSFISCYNTGKITTYYATNTDGILGVKHPNTTFTHNYQLIGSADNIHCTAEFRTVSELNNKLSEMNTAILNAGYYNIKYISATDNLPYLDTEKTQPLTNILASGEYPIFTKQDLEAIDDNATTQKRNYRMRANIDLGSATNNIAPISSFGGVFDGNDKIIETLHIENTSANGFALFKIIASSATIKDLTLDKPTVVGLNNVAAFVGIVNNNLNIIGCHVIGGSVTARNSSGGGSGETQGTNAAGIIAYSGDYLINIKDCSNSARIEAKGERAAGIIASALRAVSINGCHNSGEIRSLQYSGGILGRSDYNTDNYKYANTIKSCYNTAYVYSGSNYAGGIAGITQRYHITNCYNTGNIQVATSYIGGIVGYAKGTSGNIKTIQGCYNSGKIKSGDDYYGGITGRADYINFKGCYNAGSVNAGRSSYEGGIVGYQSSSNISVCFYIKGVIDDSDYGLEVADLAALNALIGNLNLGSGYTFTQNTGNFLPSLMGEKTPYVKYNR